MQEKLNILQWNKQAHQQALSREMFLILTGMVIHASTQSDIMKSAEQSMIYD